MYISSKTPVVILVSPQLPENIGAVARVMSNFGIEALRIINPRESHLHPKAIATSTHGAFILKKATLYLSLEESIEDLHFVFATSAFLRVIDKCVIYPRQAAQEISKHINNTNKVGIIFGRESSGLSNSEINLANKIINIPTFDVNRSLNLAQAVSIIAYEFMIAQNYKQFIRKDSIEDNLAHRTELNILMQRVLSLLKTKKFFLFPEKEGQMTEKVMNILIKSTLTRSEIKIIHGILSAISHNDTAH